MIDLLKLNGEVREAILSHRDMENAHPERVKNLFDNMSVEEAFESFCSWHGIINYAPMLISALDSIKKAAGKENA